MERKHHTFKVSNSVNTNQQLSIGRKRAMICLEHSFEHILGSFQAQLLFLLLLLLPVHPFSMPAYPVLGSRGPVGAHPSCGAGGRGHPG